MLASMLNIHKRCFNNLNLPAHIRARVDGLADYAVNRGVLRYTAYASALKYVLENEYPEYLLQHEVELPMRGYMKCLRIWRDAGLIKPVSKIQAVEKALNSKEFEKILLEKGVPANTLDIVRDMLLNQVRGALLRGGMRQILIRLIDTATSMYGGGEYGGR